MDEPLPGAAAAALSTPAQPTVPLGADFGMYLRVCEYLLAVFTV